MRSLLFFFLAITLALSAQNAPVESNKIQVRLNDGYFDPQHQKPIEYRDDELSLQLKADGEKLSIVLTRHQSGQILNMPLPQEMAQVNEIRRVTKTTAVVRGMVNGDAYEVAILSLDPVALKDKFLCYVPTISPDGNFIAFIKFYPPHFVEGPTDKYMLYDLRLSPIANRPKNVNTSDGVNVGIVVYPMHSDNQDGDNTGLAQSEIHNSAFDQFFWAPDSKGYVFADENAGLLSVIFVKVGENAPSVCELQIPHIEMCSSTSQNWCGAHVTGVEFEDALVNTQFSGTGPNAGLNKVMALRCDKYISSH